MKNILLTSFAILLLSCSGNKQSKNHTPVKIASDDPFANTIIASEYFKKDVTDHSFLESKKGSFFYIPEGAFLDHRGKPVKGIVDIEIAETDEPVDLILSNIVMTDPQNIIRQAKTFFINAVKNGKQLSINPDKPIYIEIFSNNKHLKLYHGTRGSNGSMTWKDDADPVRHLIPVPLEMLDFLPEGFKAAVESGLPYKNHKVATNELVDSLYYSFAPIKNTNYSIRKMINLALPISKILNKNVALLNPIKSDTFISRPSGINPASIKSIRSKKFQNTLISTREFETRMQSIFASCDDEILELYINNLNKDLWEIDSLVAEKVGKNHFLYKTFRDFSNLKQTTVKISGKQAEILAQEFYKQRKMVENELQKIQGEYLLKQEKKEALTLKKIEEYKNLLQKRHEYRMQKFGFELTKTGWYNIAEKIKLQEVKKFEMNTVLKNGDKFDQTFVYIVNPKVKSIFSLLSSDNVHFQGAYSEDSDLLLWENQQFNAVGVGYSGNQIAYSISEHIQQPITNIEIELKNGDVKTLKEDLKPFTRSYSKENKIWVDLEYHEFMLRETEVLKKEKLFQTKLLMKVFPCKPIRLEFHKLRNE